MCVCVCVCVGQGEGIVRMESMGSDEDPRRWMLISSRGRVAIYDEQLTKTHNTFTLPLLTSSAATSATSAPSASASAGHNGFVPVAKVGFFIHPMAVER